MEMVNRELHVFCPICEALHSKEDGACQNIEPRKSYNITEESGESHRKIMVFSRESVENAYGPVTKENAETMISRLSGFYERYSGPGKYFAHAPSIVVSKRNIVIRQFGGLDI